MLAPLVVTATAVEHGAAGWAVLASVFLAAGVLTRLVARGAVAPDPGPPPGRSPAVTAA